MEEAGWTIEGIRVAGLISGPKGGTRILALHGWLDNAASFDALRKQLPMCRLVAIDMPGHGLSDHRSPDSGYQIWDDLPQLVGLMDALGWDDCVLLGHSRGGMIATLLAATNPDRVRALITLDGMLPFPASDDQFVDQLTAFLKDRARLSRKPVRVFESEENFVQRRSRSGEPEHIAVQLARRNLEQVEDGYAWRGDHRLSGASAVKLNRGQIEAMLKSLEMPVLNIWASPTERMKKLSEAAREIASRLIGDLTTIDVPGHHHWHMETEPAAQIAEAILAFLDKKPGGA